MKSDLFLVLPISYHKTQVTTHKRYCLKCQMGCYMRKNPNSLSLWTMKCFYMDTQSVCAAPLRAKCISPHSILYFGYLLFHHHVHYRGTLAILTPKRIKCYTLKPARLRNPFIRIFMHNILPIQSSHIHQMCDLWLLYIKNC